MCTCDCSLTRHAAVALSHHAGGTCLPTCSPALHITRLAHAPRIPVASPCHHHPPAAADQKLRAYFENYGTVQEAFVSYDKHTGRPRGFGFVVFADPIIADKVGGWVGGWALVEVRAGGSRGQAGCIVIVLLQGLELLWRPWLWL